MTVPLRLCALARATPALCLLPVAVSATLPSAFEIEEAVLRANDYYIANTPVGQADWGIGAYQTGNFDAWATFGKQAYLDRALQFGFLNQWTVGAPWPIPDPHASSGAQTNRLHADSHTAAQVYLDLYLLDPAQAMRKVGTKQAMDDLVNDVSWSDPWGANGWADDDWGWIDAFYMAGPTLARMANIESDEAYRTQLREMYDYMKLDRDLFDDVEGLWYRDANSKNEVSPNGSKVFWGRGNGWVIAGLVRVLQQLPAGHPDIPEYESMLQIMASALLPVQGTDGFWRSNLLDPGHHSNPETSGTAFFTYALAWGINHGILDASTYQPVVEAAWEGMTTLALQPSGKVGYIQAPGRAPGSAGSGSSHPYGVGAFLLAGTEVIHLAGGPVPVLADAGPDEEIIADTATYEAAFQLDGTATRVRSGSVESVTWWIGDVFLAEGWQPVVMLPRGTHAITLILAHEDGNDYLDTVLKSLAANEKLAVQSVIASTDDGNVPANTVDGDFNTRWSANGIGQWIRWDLGSPQSVTEIRLAWFKGNQRTATFDIQVSDDGTTWTTVLGNATSNGTSLELESFAIPSTTTRYIRYFGYGNSDGNGWNSITEVEFHDAFSSSDDGDALPDPWELARLGTTIYGPEADPFGKGRSLMAEFIAGTDPTDLTDRIHPEIAPSDNPGFIKVRFNARAAFGPGYTDTERRYTLWQSTDLKTDSWEVVPGYESTAGRNLPVEAEIIQSTGHSFFRLSYDLVSPPIN